MTGSVILGRRQGPISFGILKVSDPVCAPPFPFGSPHKFLKKA